jgi:hypothetical protein
MPHHVRKLASRKLTEEIWWKMDEITWKREGLTRFR